ncbi:MAG: transcriptional repressor [Muribaculaceae bacterium]|nr:transcriptional repressor [Muribaculaceae bacterium]
MGDSKTTDSLYTAFMSFLKQNKLRETYERRAVVEAVEMLGPRFDIDNLIVLLDSKGEHISRATIYNTIALLVKSMLVARQQFDSGQLFYEVQSPVKNANRMHLICTVCGKVSNMRNNKVVKEISEMKFGTFTPQYINMSVYGICSKCAKRSRRDQLNLFK